MNVQPRLWKPARDPEQAQELSQELERRRAEHAAAWSDGAAMRRSTIAAGPPLRDLDAAVDCRCSCHPRVGDLHGGGRTCGCQQTVEERRQATEQFLETLNAAAAETGWNERETRDREQAEQRCRELDAELRAYGGAAPLVFRGVVDGHGFALRARHDSWQVIVAGTRRPDADVWVDEQEDDLLIATGDESELWRAGETWPDPSLVVEHAVTSVRRWMLSGCTHPGSGPGDNFCRVCGKAVNPRLGAGGNAWPGWWLQQRDDAGVEVWLTEEPAPRARIVTATGHHDVPVSGRDLTVEDVRRVDAALIDAYAQQAPGTDSGTRT